MPKEILETPEFLEFYLPILRADMTLTETYIYKERSPLTCPVAAFSGKDDRNVSEEGLAAWQEHTTGSFESQWFDGDHFYLNGASRSLLLDLIANRLTEASAGSQSGGSLAGSGDDVR
jgi:surfactin synthase thioesterase subunit